MTSRAAGFRLVRQLFGATSSRRGASTLRGLTPRLETLESRMLLTSTTTTLPGPQITPLTSALVSGPASDPSVQINPAEEVEIANAEALPDVSSVSLVGPIDPIQGIEMFRFPVDPTTDAFRVDLDSDNPNRPAFSDMDLFDPDGRSLADFHPDPITNSIQFDVRLADLFRSRPRPDAVYLQISETIQPDQPLSAGMFTNNVPSSTSSSTGFLLSIQRQNLLPTVPSPETSNQFLPILPPSESSPEISAAPNTSSAAPISTTAGLIAQTPTPIPVATGPLPTRAVAALGGVLSVGRDAAPVVTQGEVAANDLALIDLPNIPKNVADEPLVEIAIPAEANVAVAPVRGPGGFPLLGSALIARGESGRAKAELILPQILFATRPAAPAPIAVPPAATAPQRSRAVRHAWRATQRFPILMGMSVALVMVSGMVLPHAINQDLSPGVRRRSILRRTRAGV